MSLHRSYLTNLQFIMCCVHLLPEKVGGWFSSGSEVFKIRFHTLTYVFGNHGLLTIIYCAFYLEVLLHYAS